MSDLEVIKVMSEGHPGGFEACTELAKCASLIDPDYMRNGIGPLRTLDRLGIYGPRLYKLWNNVCSRDVTKVIALLRDTNLDGYGRTSESQINYWIDGVCNSTALALVLMLEGHEPKFDVIISRVMMHVDNFSPLTDQRL